MSWAEIRFEEVYSEPSRNGVYKKKEHHGSGVKIVNMGELFAFDFINSQPMKRLQMSESEMERSGLQDGDLLFGRRSLVESGAGKCSLVENLEEPTTFESSVIRVRVNADRARPKFLFYWLKSPIGRGRIRAIVTGVNVKGIRGTVLRTISVPCPPIPTQDRIINILSAYDDLIENNRRRIQLLEQSARMLYKEWFVQLRFPGHEHVKVTDGLPDGWKKIPLRDICFDIRETVHPNDLPAETPYVGLEHIPRRSIALTDWGSAGDVESNKFKFEKGDILFGKIRPYFHKVVFTSFDGITSSDAIVVRATDETLHYYLLGLVSSDEFVALASKTVREGSKMPRADWKFLLKSRFLLPPNSVLVLFSEILIQICLQIEVLSAKHKHLSNARNILLPRIMNGDLQP